jgi:hypothetical protein
MYSIPPQRVVKPSGRFFNPTGALATLTVGGSDAAPILQQVIAFVAEKGQGRFMNRPALRTSIVSSSVFCTADIPTGVVRR